MLDSIAVIQTRTEDRVSFLLSALGQRTRDRFAELLHPLGIAPHHFGVLRHVKALDGGSQQEVSDRMHLARSAMVGLVDDLETAGLLERRRHPVDRRANALHLTAAGRRLLARADRISDQLDRDLLAALPPGARPALLDALRAMSAASGIVEGVFPTSPANGHGVPQHA